MLCRHWLPALQPFDIKTVAPRSSGQTSGEKRACGRTIPANPLFYCRSNTRRFGSVRPAVWMVIVKVLPPIGEVNSPLLST
jgi:hypothetical protein